MYYLNCSWIRERAILAPKYNMVRKINDEILSLLLATVTEYTSVNTFVDPNDSVNYPTEFLNSLEPSGMPPHMLYLKVGASIILLRNLDAPELCNGTGLSVRRLMPNVIEAVILTGVASNDVVFIPRIPFISTEFKRLQFDLLSRCP